MAPSRREFLQTLSAAGLAHVLASHHHLCRAEENPDDSSPQAWPDNPFLQGNYAPVHEEITAEQLKVIGELPKSLQGMFVRNGPNPQFPPKGNYHWFDGDGMLHGVLLRDGQASYRNRHVRTAGFEEERDAGKSLWGGLLDPPDMNRILAGQDPFKNTANTALVWHDGRMLALWEGGPPHEIRLPALETVGKYTYDGQLAHPFTAHPKLDPDSGEMIFFGYQVVAPYLQHSVVAADGTLSKTTAIDLPRSVMMHDFAVTKNYSVFMDLPVTLSVARSMRAQPMMKYKPEFVARVGILPRHGDGDSIRWFEIEPCYVFHTLNAYEEGQTVVLEACRFESFPDMLAGGTSKSSDPLAGGGPEAPKLHRWKFDLNSGAVNESPLDDLSVEFPRVNDRLLGRSAQFGYAMTTEESGLVKYDLTKGTRETHAHGPGRDGGEGVFVSQPGSTSEDEGWLLTYVYDQAENRSELVVVDAQDMAGPPVARVLIPARIPFGFHGLWVGDDALTGLNA